MTAINGFPAATATAKGDPWGFRLYAIRFGSEVYRFIFAAKNKSPELDKQFREAVASFRRMSNAEIRSARPLRIKVVTVTRNDTVERLAARLDPVEHLHGAVDGGAFLVAGDQERDGALRAAAVRREVAERGRDEAGDAALHIDGAAAVEDAVANFTGERRHGPGFEIARRHDIGVSGEAEMRAARANARVEVLHIRRTGFRERHAVHGETAPLQHAGEILQRAAFGRRHRRTADQVAGDRERVAGHESERFGQTGLFQDFIGGVPGFGRTGHVKCLPFTGLNHVSWLPLPGRTGRQPCSRRITTRSR